METLTHAGAVDIRSAAESTRGERQEVTAPQAAARGGKFESECAAQTWAHTTALTQV